MYFVFAVPESMVRPWIVIGLVEREAMDRGFVSGGVSRPWIGGLSQVK